MSKNARINRLEDVIKLFFQALAEGMDEAEFVKLVEGLRKRLSS